MSGINTIKAVPTGTVADWLGVDVQQYLEFGFSIISTEGALTDFRIYGLAHADAAVTERIPIAVQAGDYTTPLWPLRRASVSLVTLAQNTLGFAYLNVAGLSKVMFQAKAGTAILLTLRGQLN